ncbi:MAG: hypothetical protein JWP87_1857 [Labilithrix sp.]|nr:hypothetical protein [Labilithrix sp.]
MSIKSLRFPLVTTSFATLALLAAACATEASDTQTGDGDTASTTEALGNTGALGAVADDSFAPIKPAPVGTLTPIDPIGPIGPSVQYPQTPPRVMSRSATGSSIVVNFDRVVTPVELPIAALHVDVLRRNGTTFDKLNVLASASLAPNGRSLTMNLTEPLKSSTAYYTRGNWKRCRTIPIINATTCKTFRAEFGEVIASRTRPAIVNGIFATELTAATASPIFFKAANVGAPRVEKVAVDEPVALAALAPAAGPGTFRVKSMTPIEFSQENTRDLRTVIVEFEGGTLDCANMPLAQSTFQLYSRSPDIATQQLMFHDPQAQDPSNNFAYRGNLRCQEADNRLVFTTPGRLFGDVQYLVEVNAKSKQGDSIHVEKDFYTERPGLRVSATRVENDYGTHDTCDSDGFFGSDNYCDIYVTSAIAGANDPQTGRIPESGDFGGMHYFPTDPTGGVRYMNPFKVLFVSDKPTGVALDAKFLAYDADSTTAWKKVLAVAGTIATSAGAAIATFEPPIGAITAGVGAGLTTISEAIPTNEDDKLGVGGFQFTREDNRWGTTYPGEIVVPITNNAPNRGPVKVFLLVEEFPHPWHLSGPIL